MFININAEPCEQFLFLFKAMSELKVNFYKSMLVGVNADASWLNEVALVLKCKVEKLSFV